MGEASPAASERERLEREREFLLRSLDDLERERAKGAVDDATYHRLHDDYTARAAAVIRALRAPVGSTVEAVAPGRARGPSRRRILTVAGIAAFAAAMAVALAAGLGARLPGQTSSGNTGAARGTERITVEARTKRLEKAVAANPDDLASRLLLARFLEARGDLVGALAQYDEVLLRRPNSAEAQAQAGRILYLTAQAAVRKEPEAVEELVQQSRARLDQAVALDPEHADARFFRAIVLANEFGAFADAQNDLQRYLILAPNGPFAAQARELLAQVITALERER